MDTIHRHCAGLDVHKDSVVVCVRHWQDGQIRQEVRSFGTSTRELLRLCDWLVAEGVTDAAMESTGVYWKPVWNILEAAVKLMLVNPEHVKHLPGRKSDVQDCQWLAELLQHGLLQASFVPDRPQRELRDLTRQRSQLTAEKVRTANRIQKVLEDANIKLGSVASDVLGVSGREMIRALIEGKLPPAAMAQMARGRMREKVAQLTDALNGKVDDHHRFMLRTLMQHVEHMEGQILLFDQRIEQVMGPFEKQAIERLDSIPGVDVRVAQNIVAEIGTDMSRFPTPGHLCAWAGLCPGNDQSAGKCKRRRMLDGDRWLKATLTQAAWAASHTKGTYLSGQYHRLAGRRGKKRAVMAVAHSQLESAYFILRDGVQYKDLGAEHFDHIQSERQTRCLVKRLEQMGYQVTISKPAA